MEVPQDGQVILITHAIEHFFQTGELNRLEFRLDLLKPPYCKVNQAFIQAIRNYPDLFPPHGIVKHRQNYVYLSIKDAGNYLRLSILINFFENYYQQIDERSLGCVKGNYSVIEPFSKLKSHISLPGIPSSYIKTTQYFEIVDLVTFYHEGKGRRSVGVKTKAYPCRWYALVVRLIDRQLQKIVESHDPPHISVGILAHSVESPE